MKRKSEPAEKEVKRQEKKIFKHDGVTFHID